MHPVTATPVEAINWSSSVSAAKRFWLHLIRPDWVVIFDNNTDQFYLFDPDPDPDPDPDFDANTRKSNISARYGGEEFVVAFSRCTQDKALRFCEKLQRCIEHHT